MLLTRRYFLMNSVAALFSLDIFKVYSNEKKLLKENIFTNLLNLKKTPPISFNYHLQRNISSSIRLWDFGIKMSNFQYHSFDEPNRILYTLQHSSTNSRGGKISRFPLSPSKNNHAIDFQDYSPLVGHQMLSIENLADGSVKIWAAKGLYASRSIIRFDYSPNNPLKDVQEFIVFNPDDFGDFYPTGNLSYDQKWLIVRGKSKLESKYKGYNCIAIFELSKLVNSTCMEAWNLASYIWPYDFYEGNVNTNINPQSIVSDGNHIYLIFGPRDINKTNEIKKYNFLGKMINPSSIVNLGIMEARTQSFGKVNEIEGAQFLQIKPNTPPVLTLGYVRGGPVLFKSIEII